MRGKYTRCNRECRISTNTKLSIQSPYSSPKLNIHIDHDHLRRECEGNSNLNILPYLSITFPPQKFLGPNSARSLSFRWSRMPLPTRPCVLLLAAWRLLWWLHQNQCWNRVKNDLFSCWTYALCIVSEDLPCYDPTRTQYLDCEALQVRLLFLRRVTHRILRYLGYFFPSSASKAFAAANLENSLTLLGSM